MKTIQEYYGNYNITEISYSYMSAKINIQKQFMKYNKTKKKQKTSIIDENDNGIQRQKNKKVNF